MLKHLSSFFIHTLSHTHTYTHAHIHTRTHKTTFLSQTHLLLSNTNNSHSPCLSRTHRDTLAPTHTHIMLYNACCLRQNQTHSYFQGRNVRTMISSNFRVGAFCRYFANPTTVHSWHDACVVQLCVWERVCVCCTCAWERVFVVYLCVKECLCLCVWCTCVCERDNTVFLCVCVCVYVRGSTHGMK